MRPLATDHVPAGIALYKRIRQDIEGKILSGRWPPGHRIPFEHELMQTYQCSRMTVNKVLSGLATAGLIERRRRTGSVVARPRVESAVIQIPDMQAEVESRGQVYGYELLSGQKRRATKTDGERLGTRQVAHVMALRCRHLAQGQPLALEERLLSLDAVPEALKQDFSAVPPGTWLLSHVPWNEAENRISACGADERAADALHVELGSPCLAVERRTWRAGQIITFVRLTFPAELYHLVARFTPAHAGRP